VYDWLFEGRLTVYLTLLAVAVVSAVAWKQTPRRPYLIIFGLAAGLIAIFFLLDRLVETDREQIQRKTQEMAANVRLRNVAAIFDHISDDFRFGSHTKDDFRRFAEVQLRNGSVDEVEVWDFQFPEEFREPFQVPGSGRNTEVAHFSFRAKPKGGMAQGQFFLCEVRFVRDADGQWRMLDFQLFPPDVSSHQPVHIPGL
jgi:hypothetical protein